MSMINDPIFPRAVSFDSGDARSVGARRFPRRLSRPWQHHWVVNLVCRVLLGAFVAFGALGVLFLVTVNVAPESPVTPNAWAVNKEGTWLITLAVGCGIIRIVLSMWFRVQLRSVRYGAVEFHHRSKLPVDMNGLVRVKRLLVRAGSTYSDAEISEASIHLTNPALLNYRIGHELDLTSHMYSHTVTRAITTLDAGESHNFAIIHRARKGAILDNFSVEVDGKKSSDLGFSDGQALTSIALTAIYQRLLGSIDKVFNDQLWPSILTGITSEFPTLSSAQAYYPAVAKDGRAVVADPVTENGHPLLFGHCLAQLQNRLIASFQKRGQSPSDIELRSIHAFVTLVTELAEHHVLWTDISPNTVSRSAQNWRRVVVKYATRHSPEWGGVGERTRMKLSFVPKSLAMLMPLASEAHSYHLELKIPNGMYFYSLNEYLVEDSSKASKSAFQEVEKKFSRASRLVRLVSRLKRGLTLYWFRRRVRAVCLWLMSRNERMRKNRLFARVLDKYRSMVAPAIVLTARSMYGRPAFRCNQVGLGIAHVYTRGISNLETYDLARGVGSSVAAQIRLEIREKPPGILLPVALLGT
jgi:hypothetical protein